MNIYKVKFRCTKCRNVWIEDAPVSTVMDQVCPECGGDIFTLSLYNDNIAKPAERLLEALLNEEKESP